MSKEDDSERDDGHLVLPQASLNRTTMTMVETRAGEGSHSSEQRFRSPSPRLPEQQSGSDNNENCEYEVSGKVSMSMNVYMWGRGEDGQIGLGDTSDQFKPMLIESLKDVKEISCGSGHTVILTSKGRVFSWGRGDDGRLGHGDQAYKYVPRPVLALRSKEVVKITCGSYHTAAVTRSGKLYTWGGGMYGKLGVGNEEGSSIPVFVSKLRDQFVINVACGSRHTVALTKSAQVYSWGDCGNGVTGHDFVGGENYLPQIVSVLSDRGVWQITACGFHTACVTKRGNVYTWGEGKFGRLGHGDERNAYRPQKVQRLQDQTVTDVSCGGFHSAAITDTGVLYMFGGGEHGQLGLDDFVNRLYPTEVKAFLKIRRKVVNITLGWSHSVALTIHPETKAMEVYTFGNGDHGKLGHGDITRKAVPQLVRGLVGKHVYCVASYNEHTSALCSPAGTLEHLREKNSSFIRDMSVLVNSKDFHDVVFVLPDDDDAEIYAHRAILAARSKYFRSLFTSGMMESTAKTIEIPNTRKPILQALIRYLYTDTVEVSPEIAIELYVAADLYGLEKLQLMCVCIVHNGISIANAACLFRTSDTCKALKLRSVCLSFLVAHFDTVTKTDGFKSLSREQILEVLMNR